MTTKNKEMSKEEFAFAVGKKLGYDYVELGPDRHTWNKPDGGCINILHFIDNPELLVDKPDLDKAIMEVENDLQKD